MAKKDELKAYTVRLRSYPGDNTVQIRIQDPEHPYRKNTMFNIYRRSYGRLGQRWFNDRFSGTPYKTITEAKEYALKLYKQGKR